MENSEGKRKRGGVGKERTFSEVNHKRPNAEESFDSSRIKKVKPGMLER